MDFYQPALNKKTSAEKLPQVTTESTSYAIPKKSFYKTFYSLITQELETYRQKTAQVTAQNSKSELTICVAWGASTTAVDYLSILDIGTDNQDFD